MTAAIKAEVPAHRRAGDLEVRLVHPSHVGQSASRATEE